MRCCIIVWSFWLAILTLAYVRAAEPAAFHSQAELKFQRFVGGDCDNLFIVADPMPPLRRLLLSDAFRHFSSNSRLAQRLARDGDDLSLTLARLEANARFIPKEIAIGFPSESLDQVVGATRVALVLGLCASASQAGDAAIRNELPKLQAMLLETAQAIRAPRLTLWVRFREPQSAESVFGAVAAVASQQAARRGYEAQINRGSIHTVVAVGDFLSPDSIAAILANFGVAARLDDPNLTQISAIVSRIEIELWVERMDDGIRLVVGRLPPADTEYPLATLGPLWQSDGPLVAYGKWHIASLKTGFDGIEKLWHDWRDSEAGRHARQFDDEDLIGSLTLFLDQFSQTADSGSGHVTIEERIEAIVHEHGHGLVDPLAASPLVQFLPRDAEFIKADARRSLGDQMVAMLSGFEDRVERNSLKHEFRGQREQSEMIDQFRDFYYQRFADFRQLVFDESKLVFVPPYAQLVGTRGMIENLQIRFDAGGGENRIHVHKSPIFEYAAIGRLTDPHRAKEFSNRFAHTLLDGFLDDVEETYFVPNDLRFGFPTFLLREAILDREPHHLQITVEGDLLPHYFVINDWIVCSTSIRMSQSIIAARNDANVRYQVPSAGDGSVVAFGVIPADSIATIGVQVGTLFQDALTGTGSVTMTGPVLQPFTRIGPLPSDTVLIIAETIRLIDRIDWTVVDRGTVRETRFRTSIAGNARSE